MNTHMQSDNWIYYTIIGLGLILVTSITVSLILTLMKRSLPGIVLVFGWVAASGLARLLIPFPWNETNFE